MNIQLFIRNQNGDVISQHALRPNQPLTLKSLQQNVSFEIKNAEGKAPKKIRMIRKDEGTELVIEDDASGESCDVFLEDVFINESTTVLGTGVDAATYSYALDTTTGFYELSETTYSIDAGISVGAVLAGLGAAALGAIGLAKERAHSGGKSRQDDANQSENDATGNPSEGSAVKPVVENDQVTENVEGGAVKPGEGEVPAEGETPVDGGEEQPGEGEVPAEGETPVDGGEEQPGEGEVPAEGETPVDGGEEQPAQPGGNTGTVITDDEGNALNDGETIADNTPTLGGSGQTPGSTVEISDGETVIGETVVDEDGNWTFTPEQPLTDGEHDLTVVITDPAGNETSETITVIVDTGNAETPVDGGEEQPVEGEVPAEGETPVDGGEEQPGGNTGTVITDDEGNVLNDGDTIADNTPTLGGSGQTPGSTVEISDGETVIGETVVDEDGNWTFTPEQPLTDGEHDLTVVITDPAGNETSETITVIVDTGNVETPVDGGEEQPVEGEVPAEGETPVDGGEEQPAQPGGNTGTVITDDEGNVLNDGDTIADNTPTLGGSGQTPGSTVEISDGETVIGETVVDEDGNWTFTPEQPLADGEHDLTVVITDPTGNETSETITVIVDTGNVETPVDGGEEQPGEGEVPVEGETPVDGGEEQPGEGEVPAEGETPVDGGEEQPAQPGGNTGTVITDDEGNVLNDGDTIADNTPTLGGSGQTPGSTVEISDGETVIGETVVDEDGNWTFTPEQPLTDGEHDLTVVITDSAGNETSETVSVVIDTLPPAMIDPAAVIITNDNGDIITDREAIADSTPTFSVEGMEPGATVIVRENGEVLSETPVSEDGSWSFTPDTAFDDGKHDITFEVVDQVGNSGGESAPVTITVDTVVPEGVDISTVILTDEAGDVVSQATTLTDSEITFSGSELEAGTTVILTDKGTVIGQTTVDSEGNWSFTTDEGLYDGSHEIVFTVEDAAGNSSGPSPSLDFTVEAITLQAADNIVSGAALGFTYDTSVDDLGTIMQTGGFIDFNKWLTSDPIVVKDGTVMDLSVEAFSSALFNMGSNSVLALRKYNSVSGVWEDYQLDSSGNLFGMFGFGVTETKLVLSGLTAGSYQLAYGTTGLNVGGDFSLDASTKVYTLAETATMTDYTTASGNVLADADTINGSDSLPHAARTTVTSVSMTLDDGTVSTVELEATGSTTLSGKYGTLTIHVDGSYEYEPDVAMDSIGKVDSFTYTITDAATGKTSSAGIHVQIGSTNDNLTLTWDPTDAGAKAVTDIASHNEANASITVVYPTAQFSTGVTDVLSGVETSSGTFVLHSSGDILNGQFIINTSSQLFGENFATPMTVNWSVQRLDSEGNWITVETHAFGIPVGNHNGEQVLNVDLAGLPLGEGTYRIMVKTSGPTNWLKLEMSGNVVYATEYDINSSSQAKGNFLTDEGTDGSVDKLSSIYTRIFAKAGDSTHDLTLDDSYTTVTESGVTLVGQYGTLVLFNEGTYVYTPNNKMLPGGSQDVFTYALKGANGEVVMATITINLGVTVEGSQGGPLVLAGTEANDVFKIYDTKFSSLDGGEGHDTLVWSGAGEFNLDKIAEKTRNIETIQLEGNGTADNFIFTAQGVYLITNDQNTLYIRGGSGDTVTLPGGWANQGQVVVDGITYTHYTSTTSGGQQVNAFVQSSLNLSSNTYADSDPSVSVLELKGALTLSAEEIQEQAGGGNSLYVKSGAGNALMLEGHWQLAGSEIYHNISYNHYTSVNAQGETVHLYLDNTLNITPGETASADNAADITSDVEVLAENVNQTTTHQAASGQFTSDSFTINAASDLQSLGLKVNGAAIDINNVVNIKWSLQMFNEQSGNWETVSGGDRILPSGSALNVSFSEQEPGTYRVVVSSTQTGHPGLMWTTNYDEIQVAVNVNVTSTTEYVAVNQTTISNSVFAADSADSGLLVKSVAVGVVSGVASYLVVNEAGTLLDGTWGKLTIHQDGSYRYTLNEGTTLAQSGCEDTFTYVLADGTIKNLVMTVGVAVDGTKGGNLTLAGTAGDDIFVVSDTQFNHVDGKTGSDTLGWKGKGNLDINSLVNKVQNIEAIELQEGNTASVLGLDAEGIVSITDDRNTLYVRGGKEDALALQGNWLLAGTEVVNNITYQLYTGSTLDGTAIKLYVQQGVGFREVEAALEGSVFTEDSQNLTLVSITQNGESVGITDGAVSLKGAYGTLNIDGEGHYAYDVDAAYALSGKVDTFTYTLSDGSEQALSIATGSKIDGSAGGELTLTGTSGGDVFTVYDTSFISLNGGEGMDTLAWQGSGTLNLGLISSRVNNIEKIDLLNDGQSDNLIISAESLLNVTDENNTLYVRGADGDTVELNGSWNASGTLLTNGVVYNHYTSTSANGSLVQVYIEDDVAIG